MNTREEKVDEKTIVDEVSGAELMAHTQGIAQWVRLSGTVEELEAVKYVQGVLEGYGYETRVLLHDALISLPGEASVTVEGQAVDLGRCVTHCFSGATPAEGVSGELVDVGGGTAADYDGVNLEGKIVLVDGLGSAEQTLRAQRGGARGQICVQDDYLRMIPISPLWGAPTPETRSLVPQIPSLSMTGKGGQKLRELMQRGPVVVRMHTDVDTGWRKIPELIADLPAGSEGERFVLLSCHLDSWYYGAMDNGSANATALEVARLVAKHRAALRRGLRVAFWSGHSHGRYAGSCWYADTFFEDLYDHCVAHVNVDSTGGQGATVIEEAPVMAETHALAADSVAFVTGKGFDGKRMARFGDQSFTGIGLSSLFVSLSAQDVSALDEDSLHFFGAPGKRSGGLGWWWHNEHDTVDKVDEAFLVRDTQIYVATMWRLLTQPILPFDFQATAKELAGVLSGYEQQARGQLDMARPIALASQIEERVGDLMAEVPDRGEGASEGTIAAVNRCLLGLSRALVPIGYTIHGPFDQDLGMPLPAVPGLKDTVRLGQLNPDEDEAYVLRTALIRQLNRITFALRHAVSLLDETIGSVEAA
jgi:N-acetylated-alpha-linked acidic dipeptidase